MTIALFCKRRKQSNAACQTLIVPLPCVELWANTRGVMATVSVLQLGDVHYPDWSNERTTLDEKDGSVAPSILKHLTHVPMREVLNSISQQANNHENGVIAMGDFTSRGDKAALNAALNHLSWLTKDARIADSKPVLFGVPGNHDVNRDDAISMGIDGKFDEMNRMARLAGWCEFPVMDAIHHQIRVEKSAKVHLFLINTTLGSWEKYLLPEALQPALENDQLPTGMVTGKVDAELVPTVESNAGGLIDDYYDQLDTPFVSAKSLNTLIETISKIPQKEVVVICGHHNLLPQAIPRISPYAELMNSGIFRQALLKLARPIVYLHGHIHEDRIEKIEDPRLRGSRIYCVGAPALTEGYNALHFYFDPKGNAIAMRLVPWRFSEEKKIFSESKQNRLTANLMAHNRFRKSKLAIATSEVLKNLSRANFQELVEEIDDDSVERQEIESSLIELAVLGEVEIEHIDRPIDDWILVYIGAW